jgi:FkbM family methyltransferase
MRLKRLAGGRLRIKPGSPAGGLIYDIGMNNGDDCAYYLKKGFRVLAIEANPALCAAAAARFAGEIAAGRLTVLNLGISDAPKAATFYVHTTNNVLSTFLPLAERTGYTGTLPAEEFTPVTVKTRRLSDIIRSYGPAHYIKIDIEGLDDRCLADLNRAGLIPPYISAEAHNVDSYCHLVAMGYRRFKIVAGETVAEDYPALMIERTDGTLVEHAFPAHSAGPFGEDIPGPWLDKDAVLSDWLQRGKGWFDLHAKAEFS